MSTRRHISLIHYLQSLFMHCTVLSITRVDRVKHIIRLSLSLSPLAAGCSLSSRRVAPKVGAPVAEFPFDLAAGAMRGQPISQRNYQ